jgi:hypothetical protein
LDANEIVDVWKRLITGAFRTWVVFEHGTCVVVRQPQGDIAEQAQGLLAEWGPVRVGSPGGDFNIRSSPDLDGWIVTFDHPDILTYVGPLEVEAGTSNVVIGLLGRRKRAEDARDLKVLQVHSD